ncbi:hypothetical protein [Streptomyces sp. NPDC052107]|uniref:hypothetical protein n=1 Tax=Streptomyces sp. NPDC052107 TaxID=3155632 RepID=UPI0034280E68
MARLSRGDGDGEDFVGETGVNVLGLHIGGEVNRILAAGRAPVERGFAHLKNWRILTKLRTDHARATHLLRALLILTDIEASKGN